MNSSIQSCAILVNPTANTGRAKKNWRRIKPQVLSLLPEGSIVVENEKSSNTKQVIQNLIENHNVNCIISAGGDGSLNWILNNLIQLKGTELKQFYIGAIGLGSSNDYHKPVKNVIDSIPVKIDLLNPVSSDMVLVRFQDENGIENQRYFIVNSSIGITAEANHFFNQSNLLLNWLKLLSINAAIVYAAIRTILSFRNIKASIKYNSFDSVIRFSNIAVLKNVYISGKLKYNQHIELNDGKLGVNLTLDINKWALIKTLYDLSRHKFSQNSKRISAYTQSVSIAPERIVALEMDGEVFQARDIHYSILPLKINLLS